MRWSPNSTGEWQYLTRGVFPTAPVKPFTACDMKLRESTDLNAAALAGIMIYKLLREWKGDRVKKTASHESGRGRPPPLK